MANLGRKSITQSIDVVVGSPVVLEAAEFTIPYPMTVRINPGVGGTITVEDRGSASGAFRNIPLPNESPGVFSAYTVIILENPVEGIQLTALLADGTVEFAQ